LTNLKSGYSIEQETLQGGEVSQNVWGFV
jgi:hypothetical protein